MEGEHPLFTLCMLSAFCERHGCTTSTNRRHGCRKENFAAVREGWGGGMRQIRSDGNEAAAAMADSEDGMETDVEAFTFG